MPQRTRTRTASEPPYAYHSLRVLVNGVWNDCSSDGLGYGWSYCVREGEISSSITDRVGTYPTTNKPCSHTRLKVVGARRAPSSGTAPYPKYGSGQFQWKYASDQGYGPGPNMPTYETLFNPLPAWPTTASSFNQAAWVDWETQFPATLSLPNFLLELDDLPKLVDRLHEVRNLGSNLKRLILNSGESPSKVLTNRKHFRKGGVNKDYADAHFGVSFGLAPFIGDIQKILSIGEKFLKRYRWIQRNNGKTVTLRRSREREATTKTVPEDQGGSFWLPLSAKEKYIVGSRLTINLGSLDSDIGLLAAMLHTTGFNNPVGIMWEAIPFSWLIDYALNTQALAKKYLSTQVFPGQWDVRDGWTSTKMIEVATSMSHRRTTYNGYLYPPFAMGTYIRTTYDRTVGVSTSQGLLLNETGLTTSQFKNYAALFK